MRRASRDRAASPWTRRRPRAFALCLAGLAASAPAGPAAAEGDVPVALELVLAVDVSSSVDKLEFDLQIRGLSEAFRHPAVHAAIRANGSEGIAVALAQWSDRGEQALAVGWTPVIDAASAGALATVIRNTPRVLSGGQTAIGGALGFSLRQLSENSYVGRRRVIDISGDGRSNAGTPPAAMRDLAVAAGVTVNGLAILNEEPFVDSYYRVGVIGGGGAFLITAADYEDFTAAILKKLIREITPPLSEAAPDKRILAARRVGTPAGDDR